MTNARFRLSFPRKSKAYFIVFVAALALVSVRRPALAADVPDSEALIRDGLALRRKGDDEAALKRFREAYDLSKTPRALAQMGFAEQALGRWALADSQR